MEKILRFFHTIRYMRLIQIYYRIYYMIRTKIRLLMDFAYTSSISSSPVKLKLNVHYTSNAIYKDNTFEFLNIPQTLYAPIDWNFSRYGKLWTYNLTYFDFLNHQDCSEKEGMELIKSFVSRSDSINDGMEPYPISLRGINWIKFLSTCKISDQSVNDSLYAQYMVLLDNLEYHLLGNHLLENAFSLLYGSYYFRDDRLYFTAKKILLPELEEQILTDGAHFELSPMYHQIILFRLLDSIYLVDNNSWHKEDGLLDVFKEKAALMLGWLNMMTFSQGDIPLFNDSSNGIAPTTKELNDYANSLQIKEVKNRLSSSGYRVIKNPLYEMMIDVGQIGPDYIPGHGHSDTFNFELYCHGKPYIVDTGTSTYESNHRRDYERSTSAHNTVELNGLDQSEVWGGFRVARRAYITELNEDDESIEAIHDGYENRLGVMHKRKFLYDSNKMTIIDTLIPDSTTIAISRLHFHPEVDINTVDGEIICDGIRIKVYNALVEVKQYDYANRFNIVKDAKMVEMTFKDWIKIEILM